MSNIRYDDVVHAVNVESAIYPGVPLCGDAMMPACAPERTDDAVNCWECKSITD